MRTKHSSALNAVLISAAAACAAQAAATDFTPLSFEDASTQAREERRLLLVYVSSDWTSASRFMDEEVWPDQEVTDWMSEHAIVMHIDFDDNPERVKELGIQSLPGVLAYYDSDLLSQLKEYDDPEALLAWSEDTRLRLFEPHKLEIVLDARLPKEVLDLKKKGQKGDMHSRMRYARELVRLREFDAATREFTWLWKNIEKQDPGMTGVRLSFMLSDIENLVHLYPQARDTFEGIRNRTGQHVIPGRRFSIDAFNDWVHLNNMLGDTEPLIDWAEKTTRNPIPHDHRVLIYIDTLNETLAKEGRYDLIGKLIQNPAARVREELAMEAEMRGIGGLRHPDIDDDMMARINQVRLESSWSEAATYYAGCLAADREEQAESIAEMVFRRWKEPELRYLLIDQALHAEQPRQAHLDWLDTLEAEGNENAFLRRRVLEALDAAENTDQ